VKKPLYDDSISSGENSWMTQSNASFMSIELPSGQTDDYFRESMTTHQLFSYAEAANQGSPTSSGYDECNNKSIYIRSNRHENGIRLVATKGDG
jgi:hypothetical protein